MNRSLNMNINITITIFDLIMRRIENNGNLKQNVKDLCEGFRHIEFSTNENDDVNHDNVDG